MMLILWLDHSQGMSARLRLIFRFTSSGSKSDVVVPSSTLPMREVPPLEKNAASAKEVLPVPPWPRRTTFRSCCVPYSFIPSALLHTHSLDACPGTRTMDRDHT